MIKKITLELQGNEIYILKWILNEKINNLIKLEKSLESIEWNQDDYNDFQENFIQIFNLLEKIIDSQPKD